MLRALHWAAVFAISATFSVWFGGRQAAAVGAEFAKHVPVGEYVPSAVTVFLVMLALYLVSPSWTDRQFPTAGVAAFAASVALSIFGSLIAGAAAYAGFLGLLWTRTKYWRDAHGTPCKFLIEFALPLAVIAASYLILIPSVSPLYSYHAASRSYETYLSSSSLAIRNFVGAHSFSLSPFTHTYWGMIQDVPTGLTSLVLGVLGLLDVCSLWDATCFFKLLALVFFATYVLAGYFAFLLLREFNVRWSIALATGIILFAANQFYLNTVQQDCGWMGASFCALLASLWLLAAAIRRDSFVIGGWSGLALASQLYVIAPHPEMVIYSVVTYILVALSMVFIKPTSTRLRAFLICVLAGVVFSLTSLAYLVPIVSHLVSGETIVLGEDTVVLPSFAFQIPGLGFYATLLTVCVVLEFCRWWSTREARPALLAFLAISISILLLAVPGIPAGVHSFFLTFGWTVHLAPADRLLAFMSFSTLIVAALGLDAGIGFVPPALVRLDLIKVHWPFAGTRTVNLAAAGACLFLLVVVPWMVNSDPTVAIIDGSLQGVRESLRAVLANSLTESDQRSSVSFLRSRLLDFERQSAAWNVPALTSVRKHYDALLASLGARSVSQLAPERIREFAYSTAAAIDEAYASIEWLDDVAENGDAYLANLDNPYVRVMGVLGTYEVEHRKQLQAFISEARNVTSAHNTSMMMDTRVYVGYPTIQALYIYPSDSLVKTQYMGGQADYLMRTRPAPWNYEIHDVIGNQFRRLLGIAGVGAYLMLPERAVVDALGRTGSNLEKLSKGAGGKETMVLVRDRNAYDTAYLARVVATASPEEIDRLSRASKRFFASQLPLDQFHDVLDPVVASLLAMPARHDAIVEDRGGSVALGQLKKFGTETDGPGARGGKVEIEGAVGPRISLKVACPDPYCVVVYNLAALPGWRAYVDQAAQPIMRANYGFLSVIVPKGTRFVSLFYETPGQSIAEWVSLITLIVMLGWQRLNGGRWNEATN